MDQNDTEFQYQINKIAINDTSTIFKQYSCIVFK